MIAVLVEALAAAVSVTDHPNDIASLHSAPEGLVVVLGHKRTLTALLVAWPDFGTGDVAAAAAVRSCDEDGCPSQPNEVWEHWLTMSVVPG